MDSSSPVKVSETEKLADFCNWKLEDTRQFYVRHRLVQVLDCKIQRPGITSAMRIMFIYI